MGANYDKRDSDYLQQRISVNLFAALKGLHKIAVYICIKLTRRPVSGVVDRISVLSTIATRVDSRRRRLYNLLISAAG